MAAGLPSKPVKPTAKSRLWVIVHMDVPSPCTTTGLPARIRATLVNLPRKGSKVRSYVWDGRTIVKGNPSFRPVYSKSASQAALSQEYCQKGLCKGVLSRVGRATGGFWYAEAELIKMYCPVRLQNISMSVFTSA